ncbi:hypothetical protein ACE1B6_18680 [Aerosakkonemataceae cyanobacterium BLCC-F154]|uniref:Uncharacterized protein n=1 Tax=Floridaenema fluviatile BLCC-F154 TaxID=3153640 RepID=A0ABV4YF30_9CYAN
MYFNGARGSRKKIVVDRAEALSRRNQVYLGLIVHGCDMPPGESAIAIIK